MYREMGLKFWIYYLGLDDTQEYPKSGKNCSKWLKTVFFMMLTYIFFINTNVVIS